MSERTGIEWTEATWNPTTGCTKVSPGCAHCYIERTPPFRTKHRRFERGRIPVELHPERLDQPLHWRKPRRVFVDSLSDLFHPDVPDEFIGRVFSVMALAERHTFQVLTKRADRLQLAMLGLATFNILDCPACEGTGEDFETIAKYGDDAFHGGGCRYCDGAGEVRPRWPLPNVWLGVSVENQRFADERIPLLLQTPAAVRFISAEPLLGPVNLADYLPIDTIGGVEMEPFLDWVIVGGESGRGARPCHAAWVQSVVDQCDAAHVACFVKQLGARPIGLSDLRDRKGGDPTKWPEALRVRSYP